MYRVKKISNLIFKYICLYFSMLVPKNNKILIFGAWFGQKYDDNPRYLYEYILENHNEYKAIWMTENISVYHDLLKKGFPVCLCKGIKPVIISLRAKYVFTATGRIDIGKNNIKYIGRAYHINLWHGIPLKKIMYDNEISSIGDNNIHNKIRNLLEKFPYKNYYIVSTSKKITEIYINAFKVNKEQILEIGQPRNDRFFLNKENSYKKRFLNKKIILYMPTHRNEGKVCIDISKLFILDEINKICEDYNCVFLIKKHFYHNLEIEDLNKYEYIHDLTTEKNETQELLHATDILITDYSSCYIDFLLLDRPIIFYNYDMDHYKKYDRDMYFDYENVTPGKKCKIYNDLSIELINILNGDDEYSFNRKKVKSLFYSDSAQSIVSDKLLELVLRL